MAYPLRVANDPSKGNYYVATRDLRAGEEVLVSENVCGAVCDNYKNTVCSNCWEIVGPQLKLCGRCKEVAYCSPECLEMSKHESFECQALKAYHSMSIPEHFNSDDRLEVRMLIHAISRKLLENSNESTIYENAVKDLVDNRDAVSEAKLKLMKEISAVTLSVIPEHLAGSVIKEEELLKLLSLIKCNSFGLWNRKSRYVACILTYKGSFFNHSCIPNVSRHISKGKTVSFRTLLPVKADSELCISYFDVTAPYAERIEATQFYYCFECQCDRCQLGDNDDNDVYLPLLKMMYCKCGGCLVPIGEESAPFLKRQCGRCGSISTSEEISNRIEHELKLICSKETVMGRDKARDEVEFGGVIPGFVPFAREGQPSSSPQLISS